VRNSGNGEEHSEGGTAETNEEEYGVCRRSSLNSNRRLKLHRNVKSKPNFISNLSIKSDIIPSHNISVTSNFLVGN